MNQFLSNNFGVFLTIICSTLGAIIIYVIAAIIKATSMQDKIDEHERRITINESNIKALDPVLLRLQTDMAGVLSSLEFIKVQIAALNEKQR